MRRASNSPLSPSAATEKKDATPTKISENTRDITKRILSGKKEEQTKRKVKDAAAPRECKHSKLSLLVMAVIHLWFRYFLPSMLLRWAVDIAVACTELVLAITIDIVRLGPLEDIWQTADTNASMDLPEEDSPKLIRQQREGKREACRESDPTPPAMAPGFGHELEDFLLWGWWDLLKWSVALVYQLSKMFVIFIIIPYLNCQLIFLKAVSQTLHRLAGMDYDSTEPEILKFRFFAKRDGTVSCQMVNCRWFADKTLEKIACSLSGFPLVGLFLEILGVERPIGVFRKMQKYARRFVGQYAGGENLVSYLRLDVTYHEADDPDYSPSDTSEDSLEYADDEPPTSVKDGGNGGRKGQGKTGVCESGRRTKDGKRLPGSIDCGKNLNTEAPVTTQARKQSRKVGADVESDRLRKDKNVAAQLVSEALAIAQTMMESSEPNVNMSGEESTPQTGAVSSIGSEALAIQAMLASCKLGADSSGALSDTQDQDVDTLISQLMARVEARQHEKPEADLPDTTDANRAENRPCELDSKQKLLGTEVDLASLIVSGTLAIAQGRLQSGQSTVDMIKSILKAGRMDTARGRDTTNIFKAMAPSIKENEAVMSANATDKNNKESSGDKLLAENAEENADKHPAKDEAKRCATLTPSSSPEGEVQRKVFTSCIGRPLDPLVAKHEDGGKIVPPTTDENCGGSKSLPGGDTAANSHNIGAGGHKEAKETGRDSESSVNGPADGASVFEADDLDAKENIDPDCAALLASKHQTDSVSIQAGKLVAIAAGDTTSGGTRKFVFDLDEAPYSPNPLNLPLPPSPVLASSPLRRLKNPRWRSHVLRRLGTGALPGGQVAVDTIAEEAGEQELINDAGDARAEADAELIDMVSQAIDLLKLQGKTWSLLESSSEEKWQGEPYESTSEGSESGGFTGDADYLPATSTSNDNKHFRFESKGQEKLMNANNSMADTKGETIEASLETANAKRAESVSTPLTSLSSMSSFNESVCKNKSIDCEATDPYTNETDANSEGKSVDCEAEPDKGGTDLEGNDNTVDIHCKPGQEEQNVIQYEKESNDCEATCREQTEKAITEHEEMSLCESRKTPSECEEKNNDHETNKNEKPITEKENKDDREAPDLDTNGKDIVGSEEESVHCEATGLDKNEKDIVGSKEENVDCEATGLDKNEKDIVGSERNNIDCETTGLDKNEKITAGTEKERSSTCTDVDTGEASTLT